MRTRRIVQVKILPSTLLAALNLPENLRDSFVSASFRYETNTFEVVLEHESFPELEEGANITTAQLYMNPDGTTSIEIPNG